MNEFDTIGSQFMSSLVGYASGANKHVHVEAVANGFVVSCGSTRSIARTPKQVATLVRKALTVDVTVQP